LPMAIIDESLVLNVLVGCTTARSARLALDH
jgi:hypothetical protein